MITIALAFLNRYIAYLRWAVLFGSWAVIAWSVHHVDGLSMKAAEEEHAERIVQSIPKIVTVTQTITKVIHDAKDKCTNDAMPDDLLKQLR